MLDRLERTAHRVTQSLATLGLGALLFYAVMTLADGTLRSLVNSPIEAVRDIGNVFVAVAISCCFPLAFLQESNISIKFVGSFLGRRASLACDVVAAAAVEIVILLIAWRLFIYADQGTRAGDVTFMLAVHIGPFWYAAATMIAVTAVVQGLLVCLEIGRCFGRLDRSMAASRPGEP